MAKKKKGGTGGNMQVIMIIIAVIVIFYLVAMLQEKDKKIAKLSNGGTAAKAEEQQQEGQAGYVIKPNQEFNREKIKKLAEQNLEKLLGRTKRSGENWFVDDVKFLKSDIIKISYEDGHTVNSVTFKVIDPDDPHTWVKQ